MQAHVNTWRVAISSSICRFARPADSRATSRRANCSKIF